MPEIRESKENKRYIWLFVPFTGYCQPAQYAYYARKQEGKGLGLLVRK
jgi:hypothetical protein